VTDLHRLSELPNTVGQPSKTASLSRAIRAATMDEVAAEELISRREVTAMLFAFADINANVERILRLLEDGNDGEQEEPEENS
jgi:hypothetical protein